MPTQAVIDLQNLQNIPRKLYWQNYSTRSKQKKRQDESYQSQYCIISQM